MGISLSHLLLVVLIVVLVFGTKRLPEIMQDLAKGYKAFTDTLHESNEKKQLNRSSDEEHHEDSDHTSSLDPNPFLDDKDTKRESNDHEKIHEKLDTPHLQSPKK